MRWLHRLIQTSWKVPFTPSFVEDSLLGGGQKSFIRIKAIKAMQPRQGATLIKIETDAGICGYGPCGESGTIARSVIDQLQHGRLPHLGLIDKDPLAISVHFQNMFYTFPQRGRQTRVLSGIDIALWDLAGKILGQPVSKLLGGNFRDEIPLYSHCGGGDYLSKDAWKEIARNLKEDPHGFKTYKIDIHHVFGTPMQQFIPSIGVQESHNVNRAYTLAREALGDDINIIVHCHNELDLPSAIKVAEAVEPVRPLYFEDPIAPSFSESWLALRRTTRIPIMTGENVDMPENALPFFQNGVVDCLQPDLMNSGGISGVKRIADLAALWRIPVCLHNVSGYALNMASQQVSAAIFNCPMMECVRNGDVAPEAAGNKPVIKDGMMRVSTLPGTGALLNEEYLKANRAEGEPWWGD